MDDDIINRSQVFPVRPEQWIIGDPELNEITGKVLFSQFQGNEIQYSVLVNENTISVTAPAMQKRYKPGESVSLKLLAAID
ncbi:TOBE domain-containing protein [Rhodococcus qingshengii]|nr:TOBE domain-containing protein [Rhodococcus qingshengii]